MFQLTILRSVLLKEVRAGVEAETTEECCSVDFSLVSFSACFLSHHRTICPGVAPSPMGLISYTSIINPEMLLRLGCRPSG